MSISALKNLENDYVIPFIDTYNGWYKNHEKGKLDITDIELIEYFVIYKAYNDMMPRTFRKCIPGAKVSIDKIERTKVLAEVSKSIQNYILNGTSNSFDDFHKELANEFLNMFNERVLKNKYKPICFGKAQKIINMAFKYLSTCTNAQKYDDRFSECHMALDSYILNWYYKEVSPKSQKKRWSSLNEEEYYEIQKNIREYLIKQNKNPFIEEWKIWEKYRHS